MTNFGSRIRATLVRVTGQWVAVQATLTKVAGLARAGTLQLRRELSIDLGEFLQRRLLQSQTEFLHFGNDVAHLVALSGSVGDALRWLLVLLRRRIRFPLSRVGPVRTRAHSIGRGRIGFRTRVIGFGTLRTGAIGFRAGLGATAAARTFWQGLVLSSFSSRGLVCHGSEALLELVQLAHLLRPEELGQDLIIILLLQVSRSPVSVHRSRRCAAELGMLSGEIVGRWG